MKFDMTFKAGALSAALLLAVAATAQAGTGPAKISERARAVQAGAINLDTHLDTPALFSRPGWKITDRHSFQEDGSQVDYPRMVEGGLDGGFWVIYTDQGPNDARGYAAALAHALKRLHQIHDFVAANPQSFALATNSSRLHSSVLSLPSRNSATRVLRMS